MQRPRLPNPDLRPKPRNPNEPRPAPEPYPRSAMMEQPKAKAGDPKLLEENKRLKKEVEMLRQQLQIAQAKAGEVYSAEFLPGNRRLEAPMAVMTDSYKAGHFLMYPEANEMVAYGEFREPYAGMGDNRFVFYGIRHIVENFLCRPWTEADVTAAEQFYSTHNAGGIPYPFPKDLFLKFIRENQGYIPVKLEALPEGTVSYIHTPVFQITAVKEYSRLCTFLETILTMVWYTSTVATLSRYTRELIAGAFEQSVDAEAQFLLDSRLHDFGFRGCATVEQAVLGGSAHLLNFSGSDTMSACYHTQYHLNRGEPVASSIPATEHSVMTAWKTEEEAILNTIEHFGHGLFACVLDSYDYQNALDNVVPAVAEAKKAKNGYMVMRPDSGDPVDAVMAALRAGEKTFGVTTNGKGYKVINGAGCIQGDGINYGTVKKILDAVQKEKFSVQNVAFGMGGGLLQKVNRDTMSFATKLCYIEYKDGTVRDVMKTPKSDTGKTSLPGALTVVRVDGGPPTVWPRGQAPEGSVPVFRTVYDNGPVEGCWEDFSVLKERVESEWRATPSGGNPISPPLQAKIDSILASRRKPAA
mmetsp:Transcript_22958/g.53595  ORF Transcript_22958/g.53595 Transcript_22958/m.53595 type:complete len:583 (-) Transcript_22958:382-2130(-)